MIELCDPDGRRKLGAFDQLPYGDYQQVLGNQEQWDKPGWPLDRKPFIARLDELREIRNELMHFNDKDKAGDSAIPVLRNMIELLREHGGRGEAVARPQPGDRPTGTVTLRGHLWSAESPRSPIDPLCNR
ncbi:hypothetical protein [Kitasatospora sp. NBC_01539]|uniref:hypothetical protein n=1 Tax=Kitasatospora sp. NBC_01539 TaxID=2903577 RepID=UPI0038600F48